MNRLPHWQQAAKGLRIGLAKQSHQRSPFTPDGRKATNCSYPMDGHSRTAVEFLERPQGKGRGVLMGKKSKSRQDQALRRDLQKKRRFYDFLFQVSDYRDLLMGAVVIDNLSIAQYIDRNKELDLFSEMRKAPIIPPFDKTFIEFKGERAMKGTLVESLDSESLRVTYIAHSFKHNKTVTWGIWDVTLDEHGHYLDDVMYHMDYLDWANEGRTKGYVVNTMMIALFTVGLMNCRNIQLIENEPDVSLSQEHQSRYRFPLTRFKTIGIKPVGKQYENDVQPKEYQDIMPLHLRRGHFATYTDDKPLFGKWSGTVWRSAALVGSDKNGIVIKDYKVLPPEGRAS